MEAPRAGVARAVPTGTLLVQNIKHLATMNDQIGEVGKDAAIFVRGNAIEWVGPSSELPSHLMVADTVIDGRGMVVLPGLVNTHAQ